MLKIFLFSNVMPRTSFSVFSDLLLPSVGKMKAAGKPTRAPWRSEPGPTLRSPPPTPHVYQQLCSHSSGSSPADFQTAQTHAHGHKRRRWFADPIPLNTKHTHFYSPPTPEACPITCTNVIALLTKPSCVFKPGEWSHPGVLLKTKIKSIPPKS